ncbi:hypothetical protein HPP92_020937 [Vanilla planifolia]|uniref:LON peptidase N-terminal domain and RING finger protein 1 n=1 Tax=Vanilla planifolia TaxID=51239 RepID=A0A835UK88_VANPL|nr:hypothetical protein HPP92_020937 [Vanilla planifolia]
MADSSSYNLSDVESEEPEEFRWEDAGTGTSFAESSTQVLDLMRRGNRAFRDQRFEEAISCYSKAQILKPGDPVILSNRSAAFCSFQTEKNVQMLQDKPNSEERSATASEYQPLNGLDPMTHAELALKDADKVIKIGSDTPKPYILKAKALILLERYEEAREALLSGLLVDPLSHLVKNNLQDLDTFMSGSVRRVKQWKPQRSDDFECTLCLKLLYEPVTTPCGHSFCRSCLLQSLDHGNRCPMCRMVLFISPRTYPISVTLNNIIQKNFTEEYAERKLEKENLTCGGTDILPLFVMDVVLPCQRLSLNIFEPRYRLMVRRIMEGNHRMGMVIIDSSTGTIADFACEAEILECEPLPDGRFYLEVEGRRRFQILRSWDQDGYRVAEVEWIQDVPPLEGSQEREELQKMASEAAELAQRWIRNASESARTGWRARRLELLQSGVPGALDPEKLSFWLVNLLNLRPSERLNLLRLRDTRERISSGLDLMRKEEQGCLVQ